MDNNNLNGEQNNQQTGTPNVEGQYSGQQAEQQNSGARPYQTYNQNSANNNAYSNFSAGNVPPQGSYVSQVQFEEPMSMGEWLIVFLISMIPCVNIIMLFVWAFSSTEKKSKANYAKAMLIWWLICIVLSIVISIAVGASLIPAIQSLQNIQ